MTVLVDSNVLLDILTNDSHWSEWSGKRLEEVSDRGETPAINPIIYAEISPDFSTAAELEEALSPQLQRLPLPWEAAFLAGKAFQQYRRQSGSKSSPLPDFYIGAHAQVAGLTLLTRDVSRYRTYFPAVQLIHP